MSVGTPVIPNLKPPTQHQGDPSSSSLLLSSLELSDTTVYEPPIRALLGTASHFCQVVVLKLRTVPHQSDPSSMDPATSGYHAMNNTDCA